MFTAVEVQASCGAGSSIGNALSCAVAHGRVLKVRRGLYVSNTGRFTGLRADPYRIAATFDDSAVFSFHSALELHGRAHSLSNRVQVSRLFGLLAGINRYPQVTGKIFAGPELIGGNVKAFYDRVNRMP